MITQGICTSFLSELPQGIHNFTTTTGDIFKCALYTQSASLNNTTTAYTTTGEITGTAYVAGGFAWTAAQNITPQAIGNTAFWSWSVNPTWAAATFNNPVAGGLIYNSSKANRAVAVFAFPEVMIVQNRLFTFPLPANQSSTAVLQIQVS